MDLDNEFAIGGDNFDVFFDDASHNHFGLPSQGQPPLFMPQPISSPTSYNSRSPHKVAEEARIEEVEEDDNMVEEDDQINKEGTHIGEEGTHNGEENDHIEDEDNQDGEEDHRFANEDDQTIEKDNDTVKEGSDAPNTHLPKDNHNGVAESKHISIKGRLDFNPAEPIAKYDIDALLDKWSSLQKDMAAKIEAFSNAVLDDAFRLILDTSEILWARNEETREKLETLVNSIQTEEAGHEEMAQCLVEYITQMRAAVTHLTEQFQV